MKNFCDVLLEYLEAEGVTCAFGVPGGAIMPLYAAAKKTGKLEIINACHEQGAAFMADGYARVRRGLSACFLTTGPGATNALTGVACAFADGVPMFVVSAQVATQSFGRFAFQESTVHHVDVVRMYESVTRLSVMLEDPSTGTRLIRRLLDAALDGNQGPVHLSLPCDLATEPVADYEPPSTRRRGSPSLVPDPDAVAQAAQVLRSARNPGILAGYGVVKAGAFTELRGLAESLGARVATTPKAKGALPENHPLSMGVFGFPGNERATSLFCSDAMDVLLVVGTRLGEWSSGHYHPGLAAGKTLIRVDLDPSALNRSYPANVALLGDAAMVLTRLIDATRRQGASPYGAPVVHRGAPDKAEVPARSIGPLNAADIVSVLGEILPDDTNIFVDIGNCTSWVLSGLQVRRPSSIFVNLGFGSMGHAVAAAIGGKVADPRCPVIAVCGDGAFAMNGMEVRTAVEWELPVTWIVLNNGGYGMLNQVEEMIHGQRVSNSLFRQPIDVAAVAEGLGADSRIVESRAAFTESLRTALASRRPWVIDARIDPGDMPAALQKRASHLRESFVVPHPRE